MQLEGGRAKKRAGGLQTVATKTGIIPVHASKMQKWIRNKALSSFNQLLLCGAAISHKLQLR